MSAEKMVVGTPVQVITTYVVRSLSLFSAFTIFLSYIRFKELQSPSSNLIRWHSVCFVIKNAFGIFGAFNPLVENSTILCTIFGMAATSTLVAAFLWSCCLARHLFALHFHTVIEKPYADEDKFFRFSHWFIWPISLLIVSSALIADLAGLSTAFGTNSSGGCGIALNTEWIWPFVFIPALSASLSELIVFIAIRTNKPLAPFVSILACE